MIRFAATLPSPTPTPTFTPTPGFVAKTFAQAWLLSPAFGGAITGIAAILTLVGVLIVAANARRIARADRTQRELAQAREQWWDRAQWGLEKTLSSDDRTARVGYAFIAALAESSLAGAHEGDLIAAATSADLDGLSVVFEDGVTIMVAADQATGEAK